MFALEAYLKERQSQIDREIKRILLKPTASSRITAAMTHSIMSGGKRLRPILCLASAEAVSGEFDETLLQTACALEFIHTYSLIHDDLPAMDDDDLRRGQKTCHVAFDEATAILAGDAMLTLAFQILSAAAIKNKKKAVKYLKAIYTIAAAAGHKGMIAGQMRDIASEGRRLSLKNIKKIYYLKTGALIAASVRAGAVIGEATFTQMRQLARYAENIGLAFQIIDDILNIEGNPAVIGKASGTDAFRRKATYPALIGVRRSFKDAEKLVRNAIEAIKAFDRKSDPLRSIAAYVVKRNK